MKSLFKKVYNLIPFKRELFSIVKIIWTPKESIFCHLHFIGVFKVRINAKKAFKIKHYGYQIENEIFWTGLTDGWEKESIKLWIQLCENSKVIFDLGANTGIYSLIAKAVNANSKVYAFEPVARVFAKLKENILLNNFDILPIEMAVSNANGRAIIYDTKEEHTYSVTVNKTYASNAAELVETEIGIVTLHTFIEQYNIKKIDLIKIDVETHEPEVLEGLGVYLKLFKPTLLIEILNDEIGEKVSSFIQGINYIYFNIDEKGGVRQVETIAKSDYFNFLICSPAIAKELGLLN